MRAMSIRNYLAMVLLMVGTLASVSVGQELARGVVFEDANGNGKLDSAEQGIANVVVSNQKEVVTTDSQGRYELPVSDDTIIFVTKPNGYSLPLNKNNLPQFYYIHKPNGSPKLHYEGVKPTGPLPESIDFPLTKSDESDKFSIIAMADPQPETTQEISYIRDDVLSEMVGTDAVFAVTLGDMVSDRLFLLWSYVDITGKVGIPFFNIIGNHDENYDAVDDQHSDETFHRHFGPNYYSWNYGKVHFVALDDVEWLGNTYRGNFGKKQLEWLKNDLQYVPDNYLIVLLMHIPITTPHRKTCADKDELFKVLSNRKKVLALSGHVHVHEHKFYEAEDGWIYDGSLHEINIATVSGIWWSGPTDVRGIPVTDNRDGVPNGYSIVRFDGSEYVNEFKAAGFPADYQMRIYPPASVGHDDLSCRTLLVNVFDGSVKSKVEYSLDGGPFLPMKRVRQQDPMAIALVSGVRSKPKTWASTVESLHMWSVEFPKRFAWGETHVVTVRATDYLGRVWEQSRIFAR